MGEKDKKGEASEGKPSASKNPLVPEFKCDLEPFAPPPIPCPEIKLPDPEDCKKCPDREDPDTVEARMSKTWMPPVCERRVKPSCSQEPVCSKCAPAAPRPPVCCDACPAPKCPMCAPAKCACPPPPPAPKCCDHVGSNKDDDKSKKDAASAADSKTKLKKD